MLHEDILDSTKMCQISNAEFMERLLVRLCKNFSLFPLSVSDYL